MKKIRTLTLTFLALVILVGGPFGFGRICDSDPRGGLICYCCSATGEQCSMISCSGCCGAHAGATADRWSPEMTLEKSPAFIPATVVFGDLETARPPETVYLDVPDQPPERA